MASSPLSPSAVPDFSCVKDFEHEAEARIQNEDTEASTPVDTDNLTTEFRGLEERLEEMRKAPRKTTERPTTPKAENEEEEPLRALYFVRIPKPDFDSPTYDLLQQDFEAHLAQVKIYLEQRRVHTLKKKEARADTMRALACLKEANDRVKEQQQKLHPYREQRDEDRKARSALKDSRRTIAASTEQELDQLIDQLEFRIEHETISLAEEKELHNQIKRLKASRPKVREHEKKDAAVSATMFNRALSPSDKEHLEKELKEYRAEQSMYEKMYHDLRDVEMKIGEELTQICSQLDIAGKKKDAIYAKLSDARQRRKMRKNEWQRNRDFSKRIRGLIDEKRIEEAHEECMEQTQIVMSTLMSNVEYRREYMTLWSTKRSNPMAVFEDAPVEKEKSTAVKAVKKKSSLHGNLQVLPGQTLPEAVVADALREPGANVHVTSTKKGRAEKMSRPDPTPKLSPVKQEMKEKPVVQPPAPPIKNKRAVTHEDFELPAVIAEQAKDSTSGQSEGSQKQEEDAEALEKQRMERLEAQKKKKAEQARKKKEKEAELKEEKVEIKPKEVQVKALPAQPKKQPPHPKKQQVKARGSDYLARKAANPVARSMKRKPKSKFEEITELFRHYPILIATCIMVFALSVIYAML